MKTLSAVLIVIVSAAMVRSIDPADRKKMLMSIITACKATSGANDDDVMKLMMHRKPETMEGMCMFNCFMQSMGVLKDGKLWKEGAVAWGKSMNAPDDLLNKMGAECDFEGDPNACVSGTKVGFCLKQMADKFKFDLDM